MRKAFDIRHPWFRPLWVRLLVTGICLAWATVELLSGNLLWAAVFGAAGAWLVWGWFITFDPADFGPRDEGEG